MYVGKSQENANESEEKADKCDFFLEVCLMELHQGKFISCVSDRILHSYPKPFWKRCVTIKMCLGFFYLILSDWILNFTLW